MRKIPLLSFLVLLGFLFFWTTMPTGCANIIPPSGGPRDTIPPKLVSVVPADSTLNFKGNRIVFSFDEYIGDLQDLSNNLLFTPTFEVNPLITIQGKNMTLRFKENDLLPNTTYNLNFGNAIRDVNESNILRNFVYTFSTGPQLDTLIMSGKVTLAETGGTDSTLMVVLHRNLTDSAVRNQRPIYTARVDAQGNFRFQNLPSDSFAIYAIGDPTANMRRYIRETQLFAFANSPVTPGQTRDVQLYAYKPPTVIATGQLGNLLNRGAAPNANDRRLRFTTNLTSGSLDLQSNYALNFQSPLRTFDSTRVSLTVDSTFSPVAYNVQLDSSRTAVTFRSTWQAGRRYNLILDRDFAEDSAGRKLLKTDTLTFNTKRLADYGQLNIRVRNVDATRNPVLQFVQNNQVVFSTSIKSGSFRSDLFNPGEYDLRILYDANGNGKWDPGNFFGVKRQPELAQPVPRKLVIKAGIENLFDVSL